jgi:hypothetical protein
MDLSLFSESLFALEQASKTTELFSTCWDYLVAASFRRANARSLHPFFGVSSHRLLGGICT